MIGRTIDHHARFPDAECGERFCVAAKSEGFEVVDARDPRDVHLTHFGGTLVKQLAERTLRLRTLAADCGGDYAGFGCEAVPKSWARDTD